MKILQITPDGKTKTLEAKREILTHQLGMHWRDLRPVYLTKQVTTILRRGDALVVNFGSIKMIICHERALLFNPGELEKKDQFFKELSKYIKEKRGSSPSFEFTVLEFSLSHIFQKYETRYTEVFRGLERILTRLKKHLHEENFEALLKKKQELSALRTKIKELEEMLFDILEDDEDLEELILVPRAPKKRTEELESILENTYEQFENLRHQARETQANVENIESILALKMSSIRNTIIKFDLVVSLLAVIFGLLGVVVGLYGVNLLNHLERDAQAFYQLSTALVGGFVVFLILGLAYFHQKKLL